MWVREWGMKPVGDGAGGGVDLSGPSQIAEARVLISSPFSD